MAWFLSSGTALLLMIGWWGPSIVGVSGAPIDYSKPNITIALQTSIQGTSWPAGMSGKGFADLAAQHINENPNLLPHHNIRLLHLESQCLGGRSVQSFYDTILFNGVFGWEGSVADISTVFYNQCTANGGNAMVDGTMTTLDKSWWHGLASATKMDQQFVNWGVGKFYQRSDFPEGLQAWVQDCTSAGTKIMPVASRSGMAIPHFGSYLGNAVWLDRVAYGSVHTSYPSETFLAILRAYPFLHTNGTDVNAGDTITYFTTMASAPDMVPYFKYFVEQVWPAGGILDWSSTFQAVGLDMKTIISATKGTEHAKGHILFPNEIIDGKDMYEQSEFAVLRLKRGYANGQFPKMINGFFWTTNDLPPVLCSFAKFGITDFSMVITDWVGNGWTTRSTYDSLPLLKSKLGCSFRDLTYTASYVTQGSPSYVPPAADTTPMTCFQGYTPYNWVFDAYREMLPGFDPPTDPETDVTKRRPDAQFTKASTNAQIETVAKASYSVPGPFGVKYYLDSSVIANALCFMAKGYHNTFDKLMNVDGKTATEALMESTPTSLRPVGDTHTTATYMANFDKIMYEFPRSDIVGTTGTTNFGDLEGGAKSFGAGFPVAVKTYFPNMFIHNQPKWRIGPFATATEANQVSKIEFYSANNFQETATLGSAGCAGNLLERIESFTQTPATGANAMTSTDGSVTGIGIEFTRGLLGLQDQSMQNIAFCIRVIFNPKIPTLVNNFFELHSKTPTDFIEHLRPGFVASDAAAISNRDNDWIPLIVAGGNVATSAKQTPPVAPAEYIDLHLDIFAVDAGVLKVLAAADANDHLRAAPLFSGEPYKIRTQPTGPGIQHGKNIGSFAYKTLTATSPRKPSPPVCHTTARCLSDQECTLDWHLNACVKCPTNQVFNMDSKRCECGLGWSATDVKLALDDINPDVHCKACSLNDFKSKAGSNQACLPCDSGTYAPAVGSSACMQCDIGSFLDWSSPSFSRSSSSPCQTCPGFPAKTTTWSKATTRASDCIPKSGFYNKNPGSPSLVLDDILSCPSKLKCNWGSQDEAKNSLGRNTEGYMILWDDFKPGATRKMYKCVTKKDCPETQLVVGKDSCSITDTYGIACSLCTGDQFYEQEKCVSCDKSLTLTVVFGIVLLVLYILGCYWFMCPSHDVLCSEQVHMRVLGLKFTNSLGLMIGNYNTFSVINQMGFEFPSKLLNMIESISSIFFIFDLASARCFFSGSAKERTVSMVVMRNIAPLLCMLIVFMVIAIFKRKYFVDNWPVHRRPSMATAVAAIIGVFEMLFVSISSNAINAGFNRVEHPFDGAKTSLGIEPTIFSDDPEATTILFICTMGIIFWCFGFVITVSTILYKANGGMARTPFHAMCLVSFLARFTDQSYWGSLVLITRRFFIGMAPSLTMFGVESPRTRLWFVVVILLASICFNGFRKPYRFKVFDIIDTGSMILMVIVFSSALAHDELAELAGICLALGTAFFACVCLNEGVKYMKVRRTKVVGKRSSVKFSGEFDGMAGSQVKMQQRSSEDAISFLEAALGKGFGDPSFLDTAASSPSVGKAVLEQARTRESGPASRQMMNILYPPRKHAEELLAAMPDASVEMLHHIASAIKLRSNRVHLNHVLAHAFNSEIMSQSAVFEGDMMEPQLKQRLDALQGKSNNTDDTSKGAAAPAPVPVAAPVVDAAPPLTVTQVAPPVSSIDVKIESVTDNAIDNDQPEV